MDVDYLKRGKENGFKNVIFIGNGAVENGENPLLHWMKNESTEQSKIWIKEDKIQFNTWLSQFSMLFRIQRGILPRRKEKINKELELLRKKKSELGELYRNKDFSLKARPIPNWIKDYINREDTIVICSNWDTTFWDDRRIKNIVQIHGSCAIPDTMIFPCEFLMDYVSENGKGRKFKHLSAPDIGKRYIKYLQRIHDISVNAVENCEKIFIWGLSLNDYDAEIMAIFAFADKDKILKKSLFVINPDRNAAHRAAHVTKIYNFEYENPLKNILQEIKEERIRPTLRKLQMGCCIPPI